MGEDREESPTSNKTANPRFFYGYIVVLAAFAICATVWGIGTTFGIFFKPILTEFGWTRAVTAGARSLTSIVVGLFGIVAGRLTDEFGPRIAIVAAGLFLGLGYLLMSQISNIWQFYMVYGVVIGIGMSFVGVPIMTTIARWFVKRRGLMTGIMQSGVGVGGMVMSPIAGWLILTYSWRPSYIILGVIALVAITLSGLFLRRDPSQIGQLPYGVSEVNGQGINKEGVSLQVGEFSLGEAIHTGQFWMLWVISFCFGLCRGTALTHFAAHVTDLGFSLTIAANTLAIISGASIAGRLMMGRVADVIGNRLALMISYIVTAVILLWAIVTKELWGLYLFAGVFGWGWGALAVIRMPILAEVFGLGSLGTILGATELGAATGGAAGPFIAGWLFDVTGQYRLAFTVTAVMAIIGFILTWLLKPISSKEEGMT